MTHPPSSSSRRDDCEEGDELTGKTVSGKRLVNHRYAWPLLDEAQNEIKKSVLFLGVNVTHNLVKESARCGVLTNILLVMS